MELFEFSTRNKIKHKPKHSQVSDNTIYASCKICGLTFGRTYKNKDTGNIITIQSISHPKNKKIQICSLCFDKIQKGGN